MCPKSHEIYFFIEPLQVVTYVRTGWRLCGKLSPSQCTKRQSVPNIGCVSITDWVHSCFETMSRRKWKILSNNVGRSNSAQNSTKKLPKLTNYLGKPAGSLLYRLCKLQDGCKSLRRARKEWKMTTALDGRDDSFKEVPVEAFQATYRTWESRWKKCIGAHGQ